MLSRAAEPPYMRGCTFMNHPCIRSAPRNSPRFISSLFPCHCIAKSARSAVTHLQMHAGKWGHRLSQLDAAAPVLPHAAGTPCAHSLSFPHLLLLFIAIAAITTLATGTTTTATIATRNSPRFLVHPHVAATTSVVLPPFAICVHHPSCGLQITQVIPPVVPFSGEAWP